MPIGNDIKNLVIDRERGIYKVNGIDISKASVTKITVAIEADDFDITFIATALNTSTHVEKKEHVIALKAEVINDNEITAKIKEYTELLEKTTMMAKELAKIDMQINVFEI